jgi:polyisoprenoid-binding protein YceI
MVSYKFYLSVLAIALSTLIFSQSKIIDKEQSTLNWTGKAAFNAYSLTGNLNVKNGTALIRNDSLIDLKIIVDMKSLHHENGALKSHLRSKDFFEVKTYETATFELIEPALIRNNVAEITGYFTIKNHPQKESLTLNFSDNQSIIQFDMSIDRTEYGINFNSPSFYEKLKDDAIADEISIKGQLKIN